MFFNKRKMTVTFDKKDDVKRPAWPTTPDPEKFKKNTQAVMRGLQDIGAMVAVSVFAYVLLDTRRQVKVAEATYRPTD